MLQVYLKITTYIEEIKLLIIVGISVFYNLAIRTLLDCENVTGLELCC